MLASVQNADSESSLAYAKDEIQGIVDLLPSGSNLIRLEEPEKQDIISQLPSCAVFHFAGHGMSNPLDPADSCLLVKGWKEDPVSVKDLIGLNLYMCSPWLAYLSACSTGETKDEGLYDEAIHLMSGCQVAGFQHVVGSLWEISDYHSVEVAREVYTIIKDGIGIDGDVAYAVHCAVRYLRGLSYSGGNQRKIGAEASSEEVRGWEDALVEVREDIRFRDVDFDAVRTDSDPLLWAAYIHVGL